MDQERQKKIQTIKVIISEIIMTLVVIVTVTILAFVVSGYWLNSDFKIERQGLLQVSSIPTGADVTIDGENSWFQKTNTSKVLTSGEHEVLITKDGYDSWSKKVTISEGLLYRISYPRLFPDQRDKEKMTDLSGARSAYISPNHEIMLVVGDTTKWRVFNLDRTDLVPQEIDVANVFSSVSIAEDASTGLFVGKIVSAVWNKDATKMLFNIQSDDSSEWVLLDVKNPKNSVNITKDFGGNFDRIDILDDSANNLLATQNRKLHKIDLSSKSVSSVIVESIIDYSFLKNDVIFSAETATGGYYLGLVRLGDNRIQVLEETDSPTRAVLIRFYDDDLIATLGAAHLSIYKKEGFNKIADFDLSFSPEHVSVGQDGSFIFMYSAANIATLDMEPLNMTEWSISGDNFGWLDDYMVYDVLDGELVVYDFDGLNKRSITKNVSGHFPVTITADKWLYYFSDDELVREWLIPR